MMTSDFCTDQQSNDELPAPRSLEVTEPIADEWFDETGASLELKIMGVLIKPATLRKKRCVGGGPEFIKTFGGRVFYRKSALEAWAARQRSPPLRSTSDPSWKRR